MEKRKRKTILRAGNRNNSGFSLLELLVVLVIISITLSMIHFTGAGNGERTARREALRLGALVRLASDEAVSNSRLLGIRFTRRGYVFMEQQENGRWREMSRADGPLRPRDLPADCRFAGGENDWRSGASPRPQIYIMASGEIIPFRRSIRCGGQGRPSVIEVTGDGAVHLLPPSGS